LTPSLNNTEENLFVDQAPLIFLFFSLFLFFYFRDAAHRSAGDLRAISLGIAAERFG
jgi:hypothetical protein